MSLQQLVAAQAGVISRRQAVSAGLTPAAIEQRLRLRRWRPLHPGVYLVSGYPHGDEARARAAVAWAGPGAVLSGLAAAWWHGLVEAPPAVITVTVDRVVRPCPGVVVRRRRSSGADLDEHRGLPVTALALTVLDAAVELGAGGAELLDRALRTRVGFPAVHAAHLRNSAAPGATTAARMLRTAADRSATVAGGVLVRLLSRSGITGWRCCVDPGRSRVAVAFPGARVAVTASGWAWRPGESPVLARRGWTAVHFSWWDLTERPHVVPARIRALVGPDSAARVPELPPAA